MSAIIFVMKYSILPLPNSLYNTKHPVTRAGKMSCNGGCYIGHFGQPTIQKWYLCTIVSLPISNMCNLSPDFTHLNVTCLWHNFLWPHVHLPVTLCHILSSSDPDYPCLCIYHWLTFLLSCFQLHKRLYIHKCLSIHLSVCLSSNPLNSLKSSSFLHFATFKLFS